MSAKRYTEEFKREVVKHITEWDYPGSEVAQRLRAELRRVTEERDLLKMVAAR